MTNADAFLAQYIATALWSSIDHETDAPLDENFGPEDIAPETLERMRRDCVAFLERAGALLEPFDLTDVAHDFWLTRNGHGAGFWDGDYPKDAGERLTSLAKTFGECTLYAGDNGRIYCV